MEDIINQQNKDKLNYELLNNMFNSFPTKIQLVKNNQNYTCGICDHCEYLSVENWVISGGPECTALKINLELSVPGDKDLVKNCMTFRSTDYKFCTKGDLDIRTLEIGDTVYEYMYNICIESVVKTKPKESETQPGLYEWICENNEGEIKYAHNIDYPHYSINLYNHKAYTVNKTLD